MVLAGIAIYVDPDENTDIVVDGNDTLAKNNTSVQEAEIGVTEVTNSTEESVTEKPEVDVNTTHLTVTSEKPPNESGIKGADDVVGVDEKKLESWSSSMAAGKLSRSTRSSNSSSNDNDSSNTTIDSGSAE
jgi:hypothetical protein